ncbi:MAG: hypothetical protein AAB727_00290, partial [Patescibacteria group bacterium]
MNGETREKNERASAIPPIRTYKSDVATALGEQKQSLSGLVAAEEAKRRREGGPGAPDETEAEERPWRNKKFIFLAGGGALLLIAVAGVMSYLIFAGGEQRAPRAGEPVFDDLIASENERTIPLVRFSRGELESRTTQELGLLNIPLNSIAAFHFVKEEPIPDSLEKQKVPITSRELLGALQSDIPPGLVRALQDSFFFGAYSFRRTEPFLVLKTNFYDGAFLGMLEWEPTLRQDIRPLLGAVDTNPAEGTRFLDAVIENTDVRALKNTVGEIVFLYSFVDRSTIVVARSGATLSEVARRLQAPRRETR